MTDDMSQLLFAKQLMDNVEFANESGLRNLLEIIKTGSEKVVNGTSYAPGAFAAWKELVSERPELFSDTVMRDLEELSKSGRGYGQQAARYVLKFIERPAGKLEKIDQQLAAQREAEELPLAKSQSRIADCSEKTSERPFFTPQYTADPDNAVRLLFDEALPEAPAITSSEIEEKYKDWGGTSRLHHGDRSHIESLLLPFFNYFSHRQGFKTFGLSFEVRWSCILVKFEFPDAVSLLLVWRESTDRFVAGGYPNFPDAGIPYRKIHEQQQSQNNGKQLQRAKAWWKFW